MQHNSENVLEVGPSLTQPQNDQDNESRQPSRCACRAGRTSHCRDLCVHERRSTCHICLVDGIAIHGAEWCAPVASIRRVDLHCFAQTLIASGHCASRQSQTKREIVVIAASGRGRICDRIGEAVVAAIRVLQTRRLVGRLERYKAIVGLQDLWILGAVVGTAVFIIL